MLDSVPESRTVLSVTARVFRSGAVNTGFVRVSLGRSERAKPITTGDCGYGEQESAQVFHEGRAFAIQEQTISVNRRGGLPVQFVIQNNNFDKITTVLPKFLEEANKNPVFQGVDADLKFNKPELKINIDRLKASELGVSVADVSQTLQLAFSNLRLGYFIKEGKQYQVMGQVARE